MKNYNTLLSGNLVVLLFNTVASMQDNSDSNNGNGGQPPVVIEPINNGNPPPATPPATPPTNDPPALSDEDKRIIEENKQTAIKYGGTNIDDKGNVINDKNEIVKSAEDLKKELGIPDEPTSLIETLQKKSGYVFQDESGKPKVYEDTEEGLMQYAEDVADYKANEFVEKFFEPRPEALKYAKFLDAGGRPEQYFEQKVQNDFSKLDVNSTDENVHLETVKKDLILRGFDSAKAEKMVQFYKTDGTLTDEYKSTVVSLQQYQQQEDLREQQLIADREAKAAKDEHDYWMSAINTIKGKQLANLKIADADVEPFMRYYTEAVNEEGQSQYMIDSQNTPIELELEMAFQRYKKFNFKDYISKEIRQQRVESLSERLARIKSGNTALPANTGGNPLQSNNGKFTTSVADQKN